MTNRVNKNFWMIVVVVVITMLALFFGVMNIEQIAYAEEDQQIVEVIEEDSENVEIQNRASIPDTYVTGTLHWLDSANVAHPLRRVMVELYDYDAISPTSLGVEYTNNEGQYSFEFENADDVLDLENGGYDPYIVVYAGDNVNQVYNNGTLYCATVGKQQYMNVVTGSTTTINYTTINPEDSNANDEQKNLARAFQISQAILTARDFAWIMLENDGDDSDNDEPVGVSVEYPGDKNNSCYINSTNTIHIKKGQNTDLASYESWDVIMHEYGHHIQYELGIIDSLGGWHTGINMTEHYNSNNHSITNGQCKGECAKVESASVFSNSKEEGIKIAWSEGWATAFGMIAQMKYDEYLEGIRYTCDAIYQAYNYSDQYINQYGYKNIETMDSNTYYSDANEYSIIAVLWDIYDSASSIESNDNLQFSAKKWWNVTTHQGCYTMSNFVQNFYDDYPEETGNLGNLLSNYKIAPTILTGAASESTMISTTWEGSINIRWGEIDSTQRGVSGDEMLNDIKLIFFGEDYIDRYEIQMSANVSSYVVTKSVFYNILSFKGEYVNICIAGRQTSSPTTGWYISGAYKLKKMLYAYTTTAAGTTIDQAYCQVGDNCVIPSEINGSPVIRIGPAAFEGQDVKVVDFENGSTLEEIGNRAFAYCDQMSIIEIPASVTTIGDMAFKDGGRLTVTYTSFENSALIDIGDEAFMNTKMLYVTIPTAVKNIGAKAYYNSGFPSEFRLPSNNMLEGIGNYAFANTNLQRIVLSESVTYIGNYAFRNCNELTIYTQFDSQPSDWWPLWNSSNRPVVWGCTLSIDKSYVVSFTKSASNPSNATATNGITEPFRFGYTFGGWYTTDDFSGTKYDDILSAPNGILYAKWTEKSCVAEGTLITLANGSQVAVEDLTGNEQLLVWNMLTGEFDVAPILFIDSDSVMQYEIIELTFSDGTQVKVIDEHAFFDVNLNKYVFLREDAYQYIGHYFNKQGYDGDGNMIWTTVQLVDVDIYAETTTAWSPVTYGHLCYYVNGMLSMPGATQGFINIFEVDTETMRYDMTAYNNDINTYGLFTYEEFCLEVIEIPEVIFNAFNGQYLKVAMGKNLIDEEGIIQLVERYSEFF